MPSVPSKVIVNYRVALKAVNSNNPIPHETIFSDFGYGHAQIGAIKNPSVIIARGSNSPRQVMQNHHRHRHRWQHCQIRWCLGRRSSSGGAETSALCVYLLISRSAKIYFLLSDANLDYRHVSNRYTPRHLGRHQGIGWRWGWRWGSHSWCGNKPARVEKWSVL